MAPNEIIQKEKEKIESTEERTKIVQYYKPDVDIYETDKALVLVADVPGALSDSVDIDLKDDVLTIDARINPDVYEALNPIYTEYKVGHYHRKFVLDTDIDQSKINAKMQSGVLTVTLPKSEKSLPRKISIQSD